MSEPLDLMVTIDMIDAYLKAQREHCLKLDRDMLPGDPQKACFAGLKAAIAVSPKYSWRPMETVPKNATEFLVLTEDQYGNKNVLVCHWAHGGGEDQPAFGPGLFYKLGSGGFAEIPFKTLGWAPLPLDKKSPIL